MHFSSSSLTQALVSNMVFSILNTTLSYFQLIALSVSGEQGPELTNLLLVLWISDSAHNNRGPTLKHKADIIKLNHWNLKIGKLEVEQALVSRNWESEALATAEPHWALIPETLQVSFCP